MFLNSSIKLHKKLKNAIKRNCIEQTDKWRHDTYLTSPSTQTTNTPFNKPPDVWELVYWGAINILRIGLSTLFPTYPQF
ncbi:hypothetical protein SBF1_3850006 [Candidatus Desulfosporosinus infrequens]|uniref:Uncharacterized protein n=1 Tax=Candidatus Desulfosporosinus infrequens TaxID=2043169 RepID=A0A2U3L618_9FIRM|nr:hypothetical protein SBF1_3850006 [Candidatus Desulfosporosinus infrequens]